MSAPALRLRGNAAKLQKHTDDMADDTTDQTAEWAVNRRRMNDERVTNEQWVTNGRWMSDWRLTGWDIRQRAHIIYGFTIPITRGAGAIAKNV